MKLYYVPLVYKLPKLSSPAYNSRIMIYRPLVNMDHSGFSPVPRQCPIYYITKETFLEKKWTKLWQYTFCNIRLMYIIIFSQFLIASFTFWIQMTQRKLLSFVRVEGPSSHRPKRKWWRQILCWIRAVMCRWVILATLMWPSVFPLLVVAPHAIVVLCHTA